LGVGIARYNLHSNRVRDGDTSLIKHGI